MSHFSLTLEFLVHVFSIVQARLDTHYLKSGSRVKKEEKKNEFQSPLYLMFMFSIAAVLYCKTFIKSKRMCHFEDLRKRNVQK